MGTSRRRATGGQAPERERAALLAEHTPQVAAAAGWLRQVVLDAMPDAREVVYRGWHGLGYHHPDAGYLCAVFPRADDVLLGFERGVLLDDPHGLLSGEGRTVRYVRVQAPGDPPAERLVELIDAAVLAGTPAAPDRPPGSRRGRDGTSGYGAGRTAPA